MQELLYKKREEMSSAFFAKIRPFAKKVRCAAEKLPFFLQRQKEYMTISLKNAMIGRSKSLIAKGREL